MDDVDSLLVLKIRDSLVVEEIESFLQYLGKVENAQGAQVLLELLVPMVLLVLKVLLVTNDFNITG